MITSQLSVIVGFAHVSLIKYGALQVTSWTIFYFIFLNKSHARFTKPPVRRCPRCSPGSSGVRLNEKAFSMDAKLVNSPECRMGHQTFENVLQAEKYRAFDVKTLKCCFGDNEMN